MKYILMDLDGTITNPKLGITKSIQYALTAFGIQIEDLDSLSSFIGPPLRNSFRDSYGFSKEEAEEVMNKYREYYSVTGIYENEVYPGMEELLRRLKEAGKTLIVATSKPEIYAKQIMEHFNLSKYFDDVCGATFDNSREKKEDVIRYALDKNKITDYSEIVMVGDRLQDVEGAKGAGIACLGVLFGYGSREELEAAGADKIAEKVEDIYHIIMEM